MSGLHLEARVLIPCLTVSFLWAIRAIPSRLSFNNFLPALFLKIFLNSMLLPLCQLNCWGQDWVFSGLFLYKEIRQLIILYLSSSWLSFLVSFLLIFCSSYFEFQSTHNHGHDSEFLTSAFMVTVPHAF